MKILLRTLAAALLFAGAAAPSLALGQPVDPTAPDAIVEYGGPEPLVVETAAGPVAFSVEIADTPESRQRGMMHREEVPQNTGMLFDFEIEQPVTIWMENTLVSLDILYIRADGTIAKVIANAQPLSRRLLPSDFPVLGVLEIGGGQADVLGIAPGDLVRHRFFGTAVETAADQTEPSVEPETDGDAENG